MDDVRFHATKQSFPSLLNSLQQECIYALGGDVVLLHSLLKASKDDLDRLKKEVDSWKESSAQLIEVCGGPASVKVAKQTRDLEGLLEEVEEGLKSYEVSTELERNKAENYDNLFQVPFLTFSTNYY